MAEKLKYVMVASIDFGTTFSGYACSFRGQENDIKLNKNWGDSQGHPSYKTPTSVLLDENGKFEAFGFEAEEKYIEVDDDDNESISQTKHLFKHFKMVLHRKEKITLKSTIASSGGHIHPAIDIFTHAIRYLKDHLIEETCKELARPVELDMIQWVITVPAIWSEESKQFMREAAFRSGCIKMKDSKQLIIALEPEAASFFCRKLDLARFQNQEEMSFPSGTRYLVLDCGGGTNDMVLHEVVLDYKIKEISMVTGGSHGGNRVNEAFIKLLKELLGSNFIEEFRHKFPQQWFMLMSKFERAKRVFKNDGKNKMNIELPYSLSELYNTQHPERTFKQVLCSRKERGVGFSNGMLVLSFQAVELLFREVISHIVEDVRTMLEDPGADAHHHTQYIFMVGGFCESKFLQSAMTQEYEPKGIKVLIPSEAQLAIVKGAVLFANNQDQVETRIAKFTYATSVAVRFKHGLHDEARRFTDSRGIERCRGVLSIFVEKGDKIKIGSSIKKIYRHRSQKSATGNDIRIFALDRKPRMTEYDDDPDLKILGTLCIDRPKEDTLSQRKNDNDRFYNVEMTFGSTEVLVEGIDETTGKVCSATIDFLSG